MPKVSKSIIIKLEKITPPFLGEATALFTEKAKATRTDQGKWEELVYCILAGTQFPVRKLKPLYRKLIQNHRDLIALRVVQKIEGRQALADHLRREGYRYYNQKAAVIQAAATYMSSFYSGQTGRFLQQSNDVDFLRKELSSNIKGIGFKIASHWLRNVGYDVCTVDLHLRRLFFNLGETRNDDKGDLDREVFLIFEAAFHRLALMINQPVGVVQYSIWRYTLERCATYKCYGCPIQKVCLRGRSAPPQSEQMELGFPEAIEPHG